MDGAWACMQGAQQAPDRCCTVECDAALARTHARRFCKYPQEILLRLEQPCKIQQIQILSHEYKVRV